MDLFSIYKYSSRVLVWWLEPLVRSNFHNFNYFGENSISIRHAVFGKFSFGEFSFFEISWHRAYRLLSLLLPSLEEDLAGIGHLVKPRERQDLHLVPVGDGWNTELAFGWTLQDLSFKDSLFRWELITQIKSDGWWLKYVVASLEIEPSAGLIVPVYDHFVLRELNNRSQQLRKTFFRIQIIQL